MMDHFGNRPRPLVITVNRHSHFVNKCPKTTDLTREVVSGWEKTAVHFPELDTAGVRPAS